MYIQKFNMSFSIEDKLPRNCFQEVINTQMVMVRTYLDYLDNPLLFSPYCGNMMATFKFYLILLKMPLPSYIILSLIWEIYKISYITSGCNLFTY